MCTCITDGVKDGDMRGRYHELNSGESLTGPAAMSGKWRYKPTGESLDNAFQKVGDGHIADDGTDNITAP